MTLNFATLPPGLTGLAVQCGSGNDVVDASAFTGQETIVGGAGNDVIKVGAVIGNTSQLTGTPTTELDLEVQNGSGSNTVTVNQSGVKVSSFTESLSQFATFGKLVVVGGAGINTFTTDGSIPNVVLKGGSGLNVTNNLSATGGTSQLIGGDGGATNNLTATGGTSRLIGGTGATNNFKVLGTGNYTVNGGTPTAAMATPSSSGSNAPSPSGMTQSAAALSQARDGMAVATVGNDTLFAGGSSNSIFNNPTAAVDIYDASTGHWSTASLSQARDSMAVGTVGSQAIFAGGIAPGIVNFGANISAAVDIYDASTGRWSSASLSQARYSMNVATVGTDVIFAGGYYRTGPSSPASNPSTAVDIFDASTGRWSTASLSQPRVSMTVAIVGSKAIFAGGDTSDTTYGAAVDTFDASTGRWSTATLSQARDGMAVTTVGSKAIFAGGSGVNYLGTNGTYGPVNAVDIFDANTGGWSTATLSQARYSMAAATVGTKAVFAGGFDGFYPSAAVDIYDASTGHWSTTTLSQARDNLAMATVGTQAIFAGGISNIANGGNNTGSAAVDIFDASTGRWSTATLSQARTSMDVATVGTKVIFAGGLSGDSNTLYAAVDIYDMSTGRWSTAILSQARDRTAVATSGTEAIFGGGMLLSAVSGAVDILTFPPIVSMTTPSAASNGMATISYSLINSPSNAESVQVQYSVNGGPWQAATAGSGGDGTSNLAASPLGTAHTFVWNTAHDLGTTDNPSVQVRIAPSDAVGTGVTQVSAPFAVNNSGVVNALTIAFTDSGNDTVTLTQSGSTINFNGSLAGGSLNLIGTATNLTSLTVNGGTGKNTINASGVQMPVSLYAGAGASADTLIGGSGSNTLFYSGVGSSYDGGSGGDSTLDYAANPGDLIAFGGGSLVVNSQAKPIGSLTRVENFFASGTPAAVNGGVQFFLPINDVPLTNVAVTSVTVASGLPAAVLAATFTDLYPGIAAGTDTATLNWGDGTTSTGTITSSGGSNFTVSASHVYAVDLTWIISLSLIDPNGSATSIGQSFTGGLALDGVGNLKNYSSASASTTVDTGVSSYVVRNADGVTFALHTSGSLWAIPSIGSKTQADGGDQSIALGPDGRLYALHADGSLYAAPTGSVNPAFVESGVSKIVADASGDLYKLYATGALSAMQVGSTTWMPVLTNVNSVTASGGGVNVVTNAGLDWQFAGTTGTLVAGPHLAFTNSATVTAGQSSNVTLAVLDVFNNPVLGYTGTVTSTDSDAPAVASGDGPPLNHTFTAGDNGRFTFPVTFLTSGPQTLSVVDNGGLTASATVNVNAGVATQFSVDPPPVVVGTSAPITVTAYDAYGNVATGYTGPVTLTPVDGSSASPINYTFTAADQAAHQFGVTFSKPGGEKLVATGGSLAGNGAILVTPAAYDLAKSTISASPFVVAGGGQVAVTLIARDSLGNQETSGGLVVAFALAAGSTSGGSFATTVDNNDGTYTALFTAGTHPGLDNFTATIAGTAVTSSPAAVTIVAATATGLTFSPSPAQFGQSVTMTATVSSTSGTTVPTGVVTFLDGATVLGSGTLDGAGRAVLPTSGLATGTHAITVRYSGDPSDAASVGSNSLTVTPNATLSFGNLAFTYTGSAQTTTVTTSPANLTGLTVTYAQNGATVAQPTAAGSYTVTASLSSTNFVATTITGTLTINPAAPTITWVNPAAIISGTPLGSAQLDASASVPGTLNYGPPLGTVLNAGLNQTLGLIFTPTDSIDYSTVTATATINVLALTSTSLSVPASAAYKQSVTFTAGVSATSGGAVPTGSVTFLDGSTVVGTVPLDGTGHASVSTSSLTVGAHAITAKYSGDTSDTPSTGSGSLTVTPNATLSFGNLAFTYNGMAQTTTVTTSPANLTGVTVSYAQNGVAVSSPTTAGSYTVTASLVNPNFVATSLTGTLAIGQATPTITWPNPADILVGTALGSTQLDAKANILGSSSYMPTSGTVLNAGPAQILTSIFTPSDAVDYTSVTTHASINVQRPAAPTLSLLASDDSGVQGDNATVVRRPRLTGTATFAVLDADGKPVLDPVSGLPETTPAGAGLTVELDTVSGQVLASATSGIAGSYAIGFPNDLVNGAITVLARVRDAAGNPGPASAPLPLFISSVPGDANGDGTADLASFSRATSAFTLNSSVTNATTIAAGSNPAPFLTAPGDIPFSGDFDGDGKADYGFYRPSTTQWFLHELRGGNVLVQFGVPNQTVPVPADFDGDGLTDFATFNTVTGEWRIFQSSTGTVRTASFGGPGDLPIPADFDGDRKADLAVYRPSTAQFFVSFSSGSLTNGGNLAFNPPSAAIPVANVAFGNPGDMPVVADYNGDGKADVVVYHQVPGLPAGQTSGQWFIDYSSGVLQGVAFGQVGDAPVPADYDGDGKADLAVFRPVNAATPGQGNWLILGSSSGGRILAAGSANDVPLLAPLPDRMQSASVVTRAVVGGPTSFTRVVPAGNTAPSLSTGSTPGASKAANRAMTPPPAFAVRRRPAQEEAPKAKHRAANGSIHDAALDKLGRFKVKCLVNA